MEKKRLSYEEKYEIMTEYIRKTGESIKNSTVYNGYNIGIWKQNLRQYYFAGDLKISDDLLEKFIKAGIIKRERKKIPIDKKYDFLMSLIGKSAEERKTAKMESGLSYREVINFFQNNLNLLTPNQRDILEKNGFFNDSQEGKAQLSEKYGGLPYGYANKIKELYGSYDNFLLMYKGCKINFKFPSRFFCGTRIITLSEEEMTQEKKLRYVKGILKILSKEGDVFPDHYFDIEGFNEALSLLSETERNVIQLRYGFIDDKCHTLIECQKILNYDKTIQNLNVVEKNAIENLQRNMKLYWRNIKEEKKNLKLFQDECSIIEQYIKELNIIMQYITDENGGPKEIDDIELSKLGVSGEVFNNSSTINRTIKELMYSEYENWKKQICKIPVRELNLDSKRSVKLSESGKGTVGDLLECSKQQLLTINGLGDKSVNQILRLLNSMGFKLRSENANNSFHSIDENSEIEKMDLSLRAYNCLKRNQIDYVYQLIEYSEEELMRINTLGRKIGNEIIEKLAECGFSLRPSLGNEPEAHVLREKKKRIFDENFENMSQEEIIFFLFIKKCRNLLESYTKKYAVVKAKRDELLERVSRYNQAYESYMNEENIFDPNGIVPAVPKGDNLISAESSRGALVASSDTFRPNNLEEELI